MRWDIKVGEIVEILCSADVTRDRTRVDDVKLQCELGIVLSHGVDRKTSQG